VSHCSVHIEADVGAVARGAADVVAGAVATAVAARGAANVMFAAGTSQLALLAELATRRGLRWRDVTGFHMDEYLGVGIDDPVGFAHYMREHVATPLQPGAFHYLDGAAADPGAECVRYAAVLADHPRDVCCLGIGENGHLAFNDPAVADFTDPQTVKVVELEEASRRQQVGEGHFAAVDEVPSRALTVTIPALVAASTVVVVAPETRKATAVREALDGPVSTACPASILQRLDHAHVFLDPASAALLRASK
jgi:glucosamine-6-phosphate deaminase